MTAITRALKRFLPDRPTSLRILRGPFRGGRIVMNPRNSGRKMLGLYEHELNDWLEAALIRVDRVIDVGANDGYFTFGCASALRRMEKHGEIIAFEPNHDHFKTLQQSIKEQPDDPERFTLIQSLVGAEVRSGVTTLNNVRWKNGNQAARTNTLIKIDVEGAEEEVLAGAGSWLNPTNCFLIEVHEKPFLESIVRLFSEQGLPLDRVDQRPLKFIGREVRDEQNWWLVSRLEQ